MSNMENKYIPVEQIEVTGNLVNRVMFKNPIPAYATALTGAAMFLLKNTTTTVIGVLLIICALCYIFLIKDRHTVDVYDDCVVLYDEKDERLARKIMYDEITEWSFFDSNVRNSCIILTLGDNTQIATTTFQLAKYFNSLRKTIPQKELRQKQLNAAHKRLSEFRFGRPKPAKKENEEEK